MSSFKVHQELAKLPAVIEVQGIFIKQYPFKIPPPTISDKGIVYIDSGVLVYKGTAGTISMVANA